MSIMHTCSISSNLLSYKSQTNFPVPAGPLYHSVRVHSSSLNLRLRSLTSTSGHRSLELDHQPSVLREHSPLSLHYCLQLWLINSPLIELTLWSAFEFWFPGLTLPQSLRTDQGRVQQCVTKKRRSHGQQQHQHHEEGETERTSFWT